MIEMPLFKKLQAYDVMLASKSPRRQQLLRELGIRFSVVNDGNSDESYPEELVREQIPLFLARKKASGYQHLIKERSILITADTIVWHDDKVIPKPLDAMDAMNMLQRLSATWHEVYTGVCICTAEKEIQFFSGTGVYFKKLKEAEMQFYVYQYKPYDKAGAYGIQEWIGYIGVEKIEGCFYNVMGLPVSQVYEVLHDIVG